MKKGIYLAAYTAYHPDYDLDYNDIIKTSEHINVIGDMLKVDLSKYDYIIASPPCNFWSKARGDRLSDYAAATKHLLPDTIKMLKDLEKPFIIENVRNRKRFKEYGIFELAKNLYIFESGRHTYFTNIFMLNDFIFDTEFKLINGHCCDKLKHKNRQGGNQVKVVINQFLEQINCN